MHEHLLQHGTGRLCDQGLSNHLLYVVLSVVKSFAASGLAGLAGLGSVSSD